MTLYNRHKSFLTDYTHYISSAIYDIQDHIATHTGTSINISGLREAVISDYFWCDESLVDALVCHGSTIATFTQLLEMTDSNLYCRPFSFDFGYENKFAVDFDKLYCIPTELDRYRKILEFAMNKAVHRP